MEQEQKQKEQMRIDGRRVVAMIPPTSWVKGLGHRPAFVFEGDDCMTAQGGGDKAPWYWGDPNDCAKSLKLAEATAEEYNAKNGYSKEEADKIVMDSVCLSMRQRRR